MREVFGHDEIARTMGKSEENCRQVSCPPIRGSPTAPFRGFAGAGGISIVGVDRNPYYPYYRIKLDVERLIERHSVPWTILRATQFYEFVLRLIRLVERLPVAMIPKGLLMQPIEVKEVAGRLVEVSLSEPVGHAPDIGGPEVRTLAELARTYFEMLGRPRSTVEVPLPGKMMRAFREGAQLCPEQAYGRVTWEDFLRREIHPATDGEGVRGAIR